MSVIRGLPRVFRDAKAILGESLVWNADARELMWCDISAGLLHRSPIDGPEDGSEDVVTEFPPPLASFGFANGGFANGGFANGGFARGGLANGGSSIVASLGDRVIIRHSDGTIDTLAEIDHAHPGLRLNEGKPDPFGNWVTGSMDLTTGDPDGAYYRIAPDGTQRVLRGGFGVANGLEFAPGAPDSADDGAPDPAPNSATTIPDTVRMYFTDTAAATIYVGDYTSAGDLTDVKPFHSGEAHDGLIIDVDGCLWSGVYGGAKVVRYSPAGNELETIELPVANVTSVTFGGDNLATLFVASARENLTEEQLREHPLSGAVFAIDTATHGFRPRRFGEKTQNLD